METETDPNLSPLQYPPSSPPSSPSSRQSAPSSPPSPASLSTPPPAKKNPETSSSANSESIRRRRPRHTLSLRQFKIFRNLLILEQSLRLQHAEQQLLRTKFGAFYLTMIFMSLFTFLRLFLAPTPPRNALFLRFFLLFQLITMALFHLSGEYKRTIVMPRKFLFLTNKSLRQLNLRLIKLPASVIDRLGDALKMLLDIIVTVGIFAIEHVPFHNFLVSRNVCYFRDLLKLLKILALRLALLNLDLGNDQMRLSSTFRVKLSLSLRVFSAEVRELWELFRNEFWSREYNRRFKLISATSHDTDVTAVIKMVTNNELVSGKSSKIDHSLSPSRSPRRHSGAPEMPPLTAQMLKSFESMETESRSSSPAPGSAIMNKSQLLRRDRDDRKVRRKSQITGLEAIRMPLTPPRDFEVAVEDEEQNIFEGEVGKIQEEIMKRSRARSRRFS